MALGDISVMDIDRIFNYYRIDTPNEIAVLVALHRLGEILCLDEFGAPVPKVMSMARIKCRKAYYRALEGLVDGGAVTIVKKGQNKTLAAVVRLGSPPVLKNPTTYTKPGQWPIRELFIKECETRYPNTFENHYDIFLGAYDQLLKDGWRTKDRKLVNNWRAYFDTINERLHG